MSTLRVVRQKRKKERENVNEKRRRRGKRERGRTFYEHLVATVMTRAGGIGGIITRAASDIEGVICTTCKIKDIRIVL